MIASASTRAAFITSVKTFISTYGVDGFEYPGAIERNTPAIDTPNLTAVFKQLRAALPKGITVSCATPTGYWFLQGFQISKIIDSVDWLNMMSYDYHGPWDTNVTDQAPVTNPQIMGIYCILDMKTGAELYVRAGINLSKVNLGLAWYGRTFHVKSSSCKGYKCTMTGGGTAGSCTQASGVLAQFDISQLIANTSVKPTLDTTSETYWLNDVHGDLVIFDQSDTWAKKHTFAAESCFGGTFVWCASATILAGGGNSGGSGSGTGNGDSGGAGTHFCSVVTWNPNSYPVITAKSETFIGSGSTIVIAVPTATHVITIWGDVITLAAGGTPINALVPTGISQPNAIKSTWFFHIEPPPTATSVTFTAPLTGQVTYSTVEVPVSPGAAAKTITGPPGETSCASWKLSQGPSLN
ncbi:glycoside hydrolase superfamily [Mycena sp. CBHHK59/15]|nr:glycoside hydrolase superfamily [Mycena sp. CBHHK59/15]